MPEYGFSLIFFYQIKRGKIRVREKPYSDMIYAVTTFRFLDVVPMNERNISWLLSQRVLLDNLIWNVPYQSSFIWVMVNFLLRKIFRKYLNETTSMAETDKSGSITINEITSFSFPRKNFLKRKLISIEIFMATKKMSRPTNITPLILREKGPNTELFLVHIQPE